MTEEARAHFDRSPEKPAVLETGTDGGAPSADDVALAFKLHKRGLASRKRSKSASKPRGSKSAAKR